MHAGDVDAQVASLEASNATLRVKIEAAEKSAKQLPYLEQQQASYESDRVKFAQLLDQLEGHKAMLSDKVSSRACDSPAATAPMLPPTHSSALFFP